LKCQKKDIKKPAKQHSKNEIREINTNTKKFRKEIQNLGESSKPLLQSIKSSS
jgi:hypothetical protein